jgi:integrase
MDDKRCSKCKKTKAVAEFRKNSRSEDGLRQTCRHCDKPRKGRGDGSYDQRPNGLWRGRATVENMNGIKERRTVYGKTKAEVQDALLALRSKAKDKTLAPISNETVGAYLDRWLEGKKSGIRLNTYRIYEKMIRLHLKPSLGRIVLTKLQPANVQAMLAAMKRLPNKKHPEARSASARGKQLALVVLGAALGQAVRWGDLARNVAELVDRPRAPHREVTAMSPEQVKAFLKKAKDDRLFALYVLAIATGARQGELLALRWSDVDLDAGTITIKATLTLDADKKLVRTEPKTQESVRSVNLGQSLLAELKAHRARLLAEGLRASPWVFPNKQTKANGHGDPGPLSKDNVLHRSFKPILEAAELPAFRFHDLRATYISAQRDNGTDAVTIARSVGHKGTRMMDNYTKPQPKMEEQRVAVAEALIGA